LSLLLTLLATPVAYSLFDDLSVQAGRLVRWLGRTLFGWRPRTAAETGADEILPKPEPRPVAVVGHNGSHVDVEAAQ